jgi:hypothetical protein
VLSRLGLAAVVTGAAGACLVPAAHAQHPTSARFVIADSRATVAGAETNDATVALGATVRFEYPAGAGKHNVNLERPGPDCVQVAGAATGARGRILPPTTEAPGWAVQCTFPVPGVYHFGSDENGAVHGVVRVANADGSVPAETPPTPHPPPDTYVPGLPGSAPNPGGSGGTTVAAGRAALKWTAAKRQRRSLRVVLTGGSDRTRVTLETQARRTALRTKGKAKRVRVGRVTRTVGAGVRVTVTIGLNARAKAALRRLNKLELTLRVTVDGRARTQTVTLRR